MHKDQREIRKISAHILCKQKKATPRGGSLFSVANLDGFSPDEL
ncbi:hypothetical protein Z949_4001 [Sulfitobacter guttiformis KCTC 32187]|nr:hypothetical protein Z949_4001 [Sulfitobacter guttiformis KCTC 32187]